MCTYVPLYCTFFIIIIFCVHFSESHTLHILCIFVLLGCELKMVYTLLLHVIFNQAHWLCVRRCCCYLAHLCVCCMTPHMKYSKSKENGSADLKSVSLPLSDQIPAELPWRRIPVSRVSWMTKVGPAWLPAFKNHSDTVEDAEEHTLHTG